MQRRVEFVPENAMLKINIFKFFFVCFNALQVEMTKKLTAFCIMVLEIYLESAQWW